MWDRLLLFDERFQLDQVIESWWRTAWARRSPRYRAAVGRAGRGGEPFTPEQYAREFLG